DLPASYCAAISVATDCVSLKSLVASPSRYPANPAAPISARHRHTDINITTATIRAGTRRRGIGTTGAVSAVVSMGGSGKANVLTGGAGSGNGAGSSSGGG